jgi:Domain of unknown function (DU1801)
LQGKLKPEHRPNSLSSAIEKGPGAMKVPYAKKWQKETDALRKIALDCDLTEELKWGKPCFTFLKKNVAIIIPLKESCAFSFFKGALLKGSEAHSRQDWGAYAGRAMDQVHLGQRDYKAPIDPEGVSVRSHRIGGVREEDRAQESFRVRNS